MLKLRFDLLILFTSLFYLNCEDLSKVWVDTCLSNNCKDGLEAGISSNCFGRGRISIINERYPVCSRCVDEILDPNSFEIVNGNNYLICDKNDDLQVKACLFYCRVRYYPYGECVNQNNFQICKCETPITPTTTSAIPNTTYNSNITVSFGPELQTLTGHKGAVYALAVLKNGDLASASWDMRQ
jgi:hypothetical protein